MKRRLYLQIYLTFVGILVLFCVLLSLAWMFVPHGAEELRAFEGAEAVLGELLPGSERSNEELQAVLERLRERLPLHLAVHGPHGRLLAAVAAIGCRHRAVGAPRAAGCDPAVKVLPWQYAFLANAGWWHAMVHTDRGLPAVGWVVWRCWRSPSPWAHILWCGERLGAWSGSRIGSSSWERGSWQHAWRWKATTRLPTWLGVSTGQQDASNSW